MSKIEESKSFIEVRRAGMTVRELMVELCKCRDLDEPVLIDGYNCVTDFDYDSRCIVTDLNEVCSDRHQSIMEVVDLIRGDRSFSELSRDTGVSAASITLWYQGKRTPSLKLLRKLTNSKSHPRYDVSLDTLLRCAQ